MPLLRPSWKTATATPTAPSPISTHTHHATLLLLEWFDAGVVPVTTLVVLFLIVVVGPSRVSVVVDVSVVVFGGAVTVVETVVVVVSVVVVSVVWAVADAVQTTSGPATSAIVKAAASLRARFTSASLALIGGRGNPANMRYAGKLAPPFSHPVWTHAPIPARVRRDR